MTVQLPKTEFNSVLQLDSITKRINNADVTYPPVIAFKHSNDATFIPNITVSNEAKGNMEIVASNLLVVGEDKQAVTFTENTKKLTISSDGVTIDSDLALKGNLDIKPGKLNIHNGNSEKTAVGTNLEHIYIDQSDTVAARNLLGIDTDLRLPTDKCIEWFDSDATNTPKIIITSLRDTENIEIVSPNLLLQGTDGDAVTFIENKEHLTISSDGVTIDNALNNNTSVDLSVQKDKELTLDGSLVIQGKNEEGSNYNPITLKNTGNEALTTTAYQLTLTSTQSTSTEPKTVSLTATDKDELAVDGSLFVDGGKLNIHNDSNEETASGVNLEHIYIDQSDNVAARNILGIDTDLRLPSSKCIEWYDSDTSSLITLQQGMDTKGSETTAPTGVKFNCDAQFTINNNGTPTNVRISELFGGGGSDSNLEHVVSALCRRVYAMEHLAAVPTAIDSPGKGGEIQPDTGKSNGDKHWITYYACLNLDKVEIPIT